MTPFPIPYSPLAAPAGFLRVTESYLCLEGEGLLLGAPVYLIRLSGCNLRCSWCDSKFSSFREDEAREMSWQDLRDAVLASGAPWVSLTGGEPTWRQPEELACLGRLCEALREAGLRVKVETNGLLLPEALADCVDLWSVSPKWDATRGGSAALTVSMHYDLKALRQFAAAFGPQGRVQFKFVISAGPDGEPRAGELERVLGLLKDIPQAAGLPVILVPEGQCGAEEYLVRNRALAARMQAGLAGWQNWQVRVLPQWHKVLYGDERKK